MDLMTDAFKGSQNARFKMYKGSVSISHRVMIQRRNRKRVQQSEARLNFWRMYLRSLYRKCLKREMLTAKNCMAMARNATSRRRAGGR